MFLDPEPNFAPSLEKRMVARIDFKRRFVGSTEFREVFKNGFRRLTIGCERDAVRHLAVAQEHQSLVYFLTQSATLFSPQLGP